MGWTVKRIQEDDYGCEERLIRVEDEWLYANGIDEGDGWPESLSADGIVPLKDAQGA